MYKIMGNGGLSKGGGSLESDKWSNSGYKLTKPTVSEILKVSCKKKKRIISKFTARAWGR